MENTNIIAPCYGCGGECKAFVVKFFKPTIMDWAVKCLDEDVCEYQSPSKPTEPEAIADHNAVALAVREYPALVAKVKIALDTIERLGTIETVELQKTVADALARMDAVADNTTGIEK